MSTGSPPCQVPSGTLRERDGNRQDGKWTHQDTKTPRQVHCLVGDSGRRHASFLLGTPISKA
ncbi:hypothetical protein ACE1AT_17520 [Pelatocladus sp. BLCC-F211]|uniref:hypothetical protein n=1 Tax=Pelatocladus sp. BLCC-F211 TaxID=3342752 RepID=UPI0035BA656E